MADIQREDFAPELLALLEQEMGEAADLVTSVNGRSYWVPTCCTKTRQLLQEYASSADAEAETD